MRTLRWLALILFLAPAAQGALMATAEAPREQVSIRESTWVRLSIDADCADLPPRIGTDGRVHVTIEIDAHPDLELRQQPAYLWFDPSGCVFGPASRQQIIVAYDVRLPNATGLIPHNGTFSVRFVDDRLAEAQGPVGANATFTITPAPFIAVYLLPHDGLPTAVAGTAKLPLHVRSGSNVALTIEWQATGGPSTRNGLPETLPVGTLELPPELFVPGGHLMRPSNATAWATYTVPTSGSGVDEFTVTAVAQVVVEPTTTAGERVLHLRIPYTHRDGEAIIAYAQEEPQASPGAMLLPLGALAFALTVLRRHRA